MTIMENQNDQKMLALLSRSDQWLTREREATLQRIALLQEDLADVLIAQYIKTSAITTTTSQLSKKDL